MAALLAGVLLLAVPTFFTVAPAWQQWDAKIRGGILVFWVAVAGVTVWGQTLRDERVKALTDARKQIATAARAAALDEALEGVLVPGAHQIPDTYRFTVYLFDSDLLELRPYWPEWQAGAVDPRSFRPGFGATGRAWEEAGFVVATGRAVWDQTFGLSAAQSAAYRNYHSVAATPVRDPETGEPIGVLSAIGTVNDGYFSGTKSPGRDALRTLADVTAVYLKNLAE